MEKYCAYCINKKALRGVLYHFTDTDTLEKILNTNSLKGSKMRGDLDFGVSLTRNPGFVWENTRITLDTNKLMNAYTLKRVDYFRNRKDFRRRSESEEVALGNIENLNRYILGIDIELETVDREQKAIIRELVDAYEHKYGLNLDTNFLSSEEGVFKFPRDEKGKFPARYDKYKKDRFSWERLSESHLPYGRKDADIIADKVIKNLQAFNHELKKIKSYIHKEILTDDIFKDDFMRLTRINTAKINTVKDFWVVMRSIATTFNLHTIDATVEKFLSLNILYKNVLEDNVDISPEKEADMVDELKTVLETIKALK